MIKVWQRTNWFKLLNKLKAVTVEVCVWKTDVVDCEVVILFKSMSTWGNAEWIFACSRWVKQRNGDTSHLGPQVVSPNEVVLYQEMFTWRWHKFAMYGFFMSFFYRIVCTVCIYLCTCVGLVYTHTVSYPCIPVISQLVLVIVQTCLLNSKDDVYEHAADIACMFLQTSLAQYGWGEHDFEGKHWGFE